MERVEGKLEMKLHQPWPWTSFGPHHPHPLSHPPFPPSRCPPGNEEASDVACAKPETARPRRLSIIDGRHVVWAEMQHLQGHGLAAVLAPY